MKETLGVAFFVWKVAVSVGQEGSQNGADEMYSGFGKGISLGGDPSGELGSNPLGYGLDNSNSIDGNNYSGGNSFGGGGAFGGVYGINTNSQPYFYLSPDGNDYEFNYKVNNGGQYFGHEEVREGDVVMGRYYVHLPDNRVQEVTYVADQNGYRATVSYFPYGGAVPPASAPPYNPKDNYVPSDA